MIFNISQNKKPIRDFHRLNKVICYTDIGMIGYDYCKKRFKNAIFINPKNYKGEVYQCQYTVVFEKLFNCDKIMNDYIECGQKCIKITKVD